MIPNSGEGRNRRPSEGTPPSKVLGVFKISDTTEEELQELFADYGEIQRVEIVVDKKKKMPKGHAFIHFKDIDDAIAAKQDLKGHKLKGQTIRLDFRKTFGEASGVEHDIHTDPTKWRNDYEIPPGQKLNGGPLRGLWRANGGICTDYCQSVEYHEAYCYEHVIQDGKGQALPNKVLAIFGLRLDKDEAETKEQLDKMLSARGTLDKLQMVEDNKYNPPRRYAFAYFTSIVDARLARHELNGALVDGRSITVEFSKTDAPHARTPGLWSGTPNGGRYSTTPPPGLPRRRYSGYSAPGPGRNSKSPGPPPRRHSGYSAPGPGGDNYNSRYYDSYIPRPEYNCNRYYSERSHGSGNSRSGYPLSSMSRDEQCSEIFQMIYPMLRKLRF